MPPFPVRKGGGQGLSGANDRLVHTPLWAKDALWRLVKARGGNPALRGLVQRRSLSLG